MLLVLALAGLGGCATAPPAEPGAWQPMNLPGKLPTRYEPRVQEGRPAVLADSRASASMWRQRLQPARTSVGEVQFSWWVENLVPSASVADAELEDACARVLFGFAGDVSTLPARTRMMFELAQALTGEAPPFATLMYVWDSSLPVGTVVINPRSDRIRKIVVDSGPQHLRQWRDHRRDLAADFRLAFGEEPGPLTSMAVMTDSDNTRSQARTWYGAIELK